MIPKEMPVLASMLAPKDTSPDLGSRIPEHMRAVAMKVDEWVGVDGWLKPGVHVDVAAVFTASSDGKNQTISRIILQNIEVVAVGGEKGQNPQDTGPLIARSVTLLVKPEEVGKLHLASEKGKIRLAMRNSMDAAAEDLTTHNESALYGEQKPAEPEPVASQPVQPEPVVQVAAGPEPLPPVRVDVVNGKQKERKVFRNADSMEEPEEDGDRPSNDAPKPAVRKAPARGPEAKAQEHAIAPDFGSGE
jgi:pilus assembly protein CpaB